MKKRIMTLVPLVLFLGCTHHKGVGKYENSNNIFDADVIHYYSGGATLNFEERNSNLTCYGKAILTELKPTCAGQKGTMFAKCSDSTSLEGTWETTSCSSGFGEGLNNKNEKFIFNFGYPDDEAEKLLVDKK
jgi:hypothetical protein